MNTPESQPKEENNLPPTENKAVPVDDPTWNSSVLKPGIMQFQNTKTEIQIGTLDPSDMDFVKKFPNS